MSTLQVRSVEVSFGDRRVLRGCDLTLETGDKVGLVGANGCGKSTLLRAVAGRMLPDHGRIDVSGTVGCLEQDPVLALPTVGACADDAVAWHADLLARHCSALAEHRADEAGALHDRLDLVGWEVEHRVDAMLDRLGAPGRQARVEHLSGGERRRVALALALLGQPDLLLLDEPTNHLDADAVEWLQAWLGGYRGAVLLVTHDRYLLEAVADRIVEIEGGRTVTYEGSYGDYLVARAERQAMLQAADDRRTRLINREAEWAARSPAARTTKQKARLERLAVLQAEEGPAAERDFELDLRTGSRRSGVLMELQGVRKAYGGRELLGGLDLPLSAGERLGVLGPNGVGKSTLLRILAGVLTPDRGEVLRASRVEVAVLDQERSGLEAPDGHDWTVFEAAGGGGSHVVMAGREAATWQRGSGIAGRAARTVHVASFLERFAFGHEMLEQRVSALSGGERARLLMARQLLRGAAVLLLDEPTNDLDLLTLRVLEEALLAFDGVAVVVTHDRAFLDRVCTGVLAFEPLLAGERGPRPPLMRYASRVQHLRALDERRRALSSADREERAPARKAPPTARKKPSFKEQREVEEIPGRIEQLEAEQAELATRLGDPETYRSQAADLPALYARVAAIPAEIESLFLRWTELEERK